MGQGKWSVPFGMALCSLILGAIWLICTLVPYHGSIPVIALFLHLVAVLVFGQYLSNIRDWEMVGSVITLLSIGVSTLGLLKYFDNCSKDIIVVFVFLIPPFLTALSCVIGMTITDR